MADIDFSKLTPEQIAVAKSVAADARKYNIDPSVALQTIFDKNQFSEGLTGHPGEEAPLAAKMLWEKQFKPAPVPYQQTEHDTTDEMIGAAAGAGTGAALVGAGAAKNAATNLFSNSQRIKESSPNTGSIGRPLSSWELSSPAGQTAEMRRLEMRDLLNNWKSEAGQAQIGTDALRTQQQAAQRALEQARLAEQTALTQFVTLGGGKKAPELPATTVAPTPTTPPAVTVDYHEMNNNPTGNSAAREISQHESAHYRSLSQGDKMKMVDRLAQEYGLGRGYVQMMLEAGEHQPTATGRVLLEKKDLNAVNAAQTPQQQMAAAMSPAERHALELEMQRRAAEDMARRLQFNEAERVLRENQSARSGAATAERGANKALSTDLSTRGTLGEKFGHTVESVQQAMIDAKNKALNSAVMRPLRAAGTVLGGGLAGLEGMDAYDAYMKKNYGDAASHGITGTGGLVGMLPMAGAPTAGALMMAVPEAKRQADELTKELAANKAKGESQSPLSLFMQLMRSKTSTPWMN